MGKMALWNFSKVLEFTTMKLPSLISTVSNFRVASLVFVELVPVATWVRTCAAANAYVFDDDDGAFSPESG
jgi:hypothetical protein